MPATPRRILLVDDEPFVLDSIRRVLQFDGHSVEVAANGAEALALFKKSGFDLVATDYEMPGMKGDALAAAIRAEQPRQPILMISAYGEVLRSPTNPLPAVDIIISKPFQIEELRLAISRLPVQRGGLPGSPPGPELPPPWLQT